ncbi:protein RarD [Sinomonas cellulolyticus]|uniref:EamA family transporter RarD n=1 Tax=Sinomonas cellulolyticus TaxID=2801916 RepID=UPI0019C41EF0|nr:MULTISPECIES: EamA family transporter RarD [Sinomonas]GHG56870.1 protein RarD [Sinomonas sp. KCTC 49339]
MTETPHSPSGQRATRSPATSGLLYGIGAYGLWGLLPLYFLTLAPAGPVEIVAGRVLFSLVVCFALIAATRAWRALGAVFRSGRTFWALALAAALIAVNWLTYTFGVLTGHTIEAALGYFINPLVSVLLGVLVLKERLRPLQWTAVGIGAIAVVVLTVAYGQVPWIALILAFSFGFYGLVKNRVGAKVDAVTSLTVETVVLSPVALAVMVWLGGAGTLTLFADGTAHFWLLAASGLITAVPLLFFGAAARRLPMTTVGLLQYIAPLLQFIMATTILGEHMAPERWIGFGIVWLALAILTADMLLVARRRRTSLRAAGLAAEAASAPSRAG